MAVVVIAAVATYFGSASAVAVAYAAYQAYNLLRTKKLPGQDVQGPRFSDLKIQSSAYGQMIPIAFGTVPISGNVIWSSEVREVATTTSQESGGKGGSSQTTTTTTYAYYVDCAILLCEGEAAGVPRIKFNGELKFDVSSGASSESVMASALNATAIRFYPGTETQAVDPTIEAAEGVDTPAYRGCAYLVIEGLDVTPYGGKLPQIDAEVVMAGSEAATLDISAGTAFSTTAVVSSGPFLGRNGNVWFTGAVSNTAVMANFYASSIHGTYTRTLWGYIPCGLTPSKEAVYCNYGGYFGILHDDGRVTEYTGAPGILGANGGVAWIDSSNGFAQGDSSSQVNLYRFVLNESTMAVDETLLTAARSTILFKNACGISGRCYVYGTTTYTHDIGYIDTLSNSKVLLLTGTPFAAAGLLVSSDGYLWMARDTSGTDVQKRDRDGLLIGSVSIPSGTVNRLFESPDGMIWAWVSAGAIYCIHPSTLDIVKTSENTGTKTALGFTEDGRMVLSSSSGGSWYFHEMEALPRITTGTTSLSTVVTSILSRVGVSASEIDVTELASDTVLGYVIARRDSARSAIEPLQIAFSFDGLESEGQIVFRKRGGAVVAEISDDDLAARKYGDDPPAKIATARKLETELPKEVSVQYMDQSAMYEIGSQYARRLTGQSSDPLAIELPIVMTADTAAQIAERVLFELWAGRNIVDLSLSRKWAHLEPADVITVTADGITYTLRIEEKNEAAGLIKLSCVTEDITVYSPVASGVDLPDNGLSVEATGPTVLRILDIPLLRDVDESAGFYAAAAGCYSGWPGADLYVSRDQGATWERTQTTFLEPSVIGTALTALSTFSGGNVFDEINSVTVQVFGGTLSSASEALVQSGTNTCYLGGEILSFKTATLVSTGRYTLSGLRRGRKGTEQYMTTHAVGEQFVLLSTSTTKRVRLESADIGMSLRYKAVTFGQYLAEAAEVTFTPAAVGLEPLSPVNIRAGRTAAASWDISIAWERRARKNAEWRSYADVPLDDSPESYEVDVYSSSAFTTIKRTITSSTETATYTSAQQVTDFGSNQTTIYLKVYQLSATTGRGFAGTATITV